MLAKDVQQVRVSGTYMEFYIHMLVNHGVADHVFPVDQRRRQSITRIGRGQQALHLSMTCQVHYLKGSSALPSTGI